MTEPVQEKPKIARLGGSSGQRENLPFRVELCDAVENEHVERVLARAFNAALARAIFAAALREYPERRITLRRGSRLIADSAR